MKRWNHWDCLRNDRIARAKLRNRLDRLEKRSKRSRLEPALIRSTSRSVAFYSDALGLVPLQRRKLRKLTCPAVFSMIEAPEQAIDTISRLVSFLNGGMTR